MENSAKASISNIGLVEALELGSTKLIGQAVGLHPDNNEPVVYSEVNQLINYISVDY